MIGIPLLVFGAFFLIGWLNLFHAHEHCIKQTGLLLRVYATEHGGRFPTDTNGFGDAILLLLKANSEDDARLFTAPGDDGNVLKQSLRTAAHVQERQCTRAYVQGLSETNNPMIAIVFDRYPTHGGDHFRRPWGPLLREVCLLDGSMEVVREVKWSEFRRTQIDLLVAEGRDRARAEMLYEPSSQ